MGFINVGQADYMSFMIAISLVFLVVSTKLTHQSNLHYVFDQQNEISSSSFPSDTSPDELPVFVDAPTSREDEQQDDDYEGIIRNTNRERRIPEETRISSRISQQLPLSSSSSSVEEDQSAAAAADYMNEVNWSRNPDQVKSREKMKSFSSKPKRSGCDSGPPISARNLIGRTIKRSHFATSKAEVTRRILEEKNNKLKRTLEGGESLRNDLHSSSCVTSYIWRNLGNNHYPQFIQTAVCSSTCANGLYECQPKDYVLKVLKRISSSDSVCQEPQDESLPSSLNSHWRLVPYKIHVCCDCSNRLAIFQI